MPHLLPLPAVPGQLASHMSPGSSITAFYQAVMSKAAALRPGSPSLRGPERHRGVVALHLRTWFSQDGTLSPCHEAPGGLRCTLPLLGCPESRAQCQAGDRPAAPAPSSPAWAPTRHKGQPPPVLVPSCPSHTRTPGVRSSGAPAGCPSARAFL